MSPGDHGMVCMVLGWNVPKDNGIPYSKENQLPSSIESAKHTPSENIIIIIFFCHMTTLREVYRGATCLGHVSSVSTEKLTAILS